MVCEGVANGKLHPVSLQPIIAQRELLKSSRNVTNAKKLDDDKKKFHEQNEYKDDEGSIIPRHQQPRAQYGARHTTTTTTTTTTVTVPKRPIVRSNCFNALKDDEEERSKREALVPDMPRHHQ